MAGHDSDVRPLTIFVDADACPVKAEVYRVAERHACRVFVVANSVLAVPRAPFIERVLVPGDPDAADDWIAAHVHAGDIVISADIPLASRCVKAGAVVLAPDGRPFTASSVGMALATRNLMDQLREAGETTRGPKPFAPRDRSAFLGALDREIVRSRRRAR